MMIRPLKTNRRNLIRNIAALFAGVGMLTPLTAPSALAVDYYWDTNGTTAGLGNTAGTWGTSAFVASLAGGNGRQIVAGTFSVANTAATTSDSMSFGIAGMALGSTASNIGIAAGGINIGNIIFGAGQTNAITLSGGGGNITLAAAGNIVVNNSSNTIGAILTGAGTSMTKSGSGTLILTGANTYTGATIISGGGILQVGNGTSGSLNGISGTALTFNNGGGVFDVREAASSTQGMGALTFSAGDSRVTSTAASGSATATLTFASLAARAVGAIGNFTLATNTTATDNKIVLTSNTNAPLDTGSNNAGYFFGGTEFARYDTTNNYFRAVDYGTDTNALAALSGTDIGAVTSTSDVKLIGNITAQTTASVNTLNLASNSLTLSDTSQVLSVNGILSTGGAISTVGTMQATSAGGEMIFNVASGTLTVAPNIVNNSSASPLTKSGAGILTLTGTNTYTGTTRVNSGILSVSGGNAIADAGAVVLANSAGATFRLDGNETIGNISGGGLSGGNVNVQGNTLTLSDNTSTTFGGIISGTSSGQIIKQGTGTLTLSNKNTFAGMTTIGAGAIQFSYGNDGTGTIIPLSSGGAFNMSAGATLRFVPTAAITSGIISGQLQAANGGTPAFPYGFTFSNPINITSGTANIRIDGNENRFNFSGNITGGTSGTQTLSLIQGGINTGAGDRQVLAVSGIIADGSGGTLGVNVDFAGASSTSQFAYVALTGQNTFTGQIVVTNTKGIVTGSTSGAYLVIGGEAYASPKTNVVGTGFLGNGNYTNTISLATGTNLNYLSSANQILGGTISGGGAILKEGPGNLALSGTNTYTGSTTVSTGLLSALKRVSLYNDTAASWTPTNIAVNSGATLALGVGDSASGYFGTTEIATFLDASHMGLSTATTGFKSGAAVGFDTTNATGGTFTLSNTLANLGTAASTGLTKAGTGTLVINLSNTYTGTTTVDQGTLQFTTVNPSLSGALAFGSAVGSPNTGTLDLTTVSATFGGLNVQTNSASNNVITIGNGQTLTLTGSTVANVVSVGSSASAGVAKLQVTGANGTFTVNDATRNFVVANTDASTTAGASAQMDLSGLGTFNAMIANLYVGRPTTAAGASTNGRPLTDSLTLAASNTLTISGVLAVGGTTNSFGAQQATLNLGTANILNAASFVVGSARTVGTMKFNTGLTNPSVTIRGAAGGVTRTDITLGDAQNALAVSNGSNGSSGTMGTMDFTGGSVDAQINNLIAGNGGTGTGGNRGSGNGTFIIDGTASNVNINTLVVARTRDDNSANASATTPPASVFTLKNGTLVINTEASLAKDIDTTNTASGVQNLVANFNIEGGNATIGSIGTPVNLVLGSHVAAGNSGSATATVSLTGGTLNIFGDIQEGTLGNGTINSSLTLNGATLDMKNRSIGISGGLIDTLTFASGTLQNVAQINNGAGLNKTTSGMLTLAGTNTYTGTSTVAAGTLRVNGSITSPVNVNAGTLDGTGDGLATGLISAAVLIGDSSVGPQDAILAPGNSVGTLTATGSLTFNSDAVFAVEVNSSLSTMDKMVANGVTINAGASFSFADLGSAAFTPGSYTIIDNTSALPISGTFTGLPDGVPFIVGLNSYTPSYSGGTGNNDLVLNVAAIPEPSTLVLGGLTLLGFVGAGLRKRRLAKVQA